MTQKQTNALKVTILKYRQLHGDPEVLSNLRYYAKSNTTDNQVCRYAVMCTDCISAWRYVVIAKKSMQ